uniref:Fe2OG dioxygenase domain-containing protein n=1 Tax=Chenopodium quinoa TaxID=63459 RepID=A0A803MDK0_CHEQI
MTGNKDMFIKLDMGVANQVTLGDGKKANVEGRGVIAVNSKANNTKYIHDVLYVPNLTHNLLSVGKLVQRGYSANFDNGECIVTDKKSGTILAKVQMADNKVFPLHMPQKKLALQANVMDESYLWHLRYGHLNQKGLQLLKQKDMVVGLPHIDRNIQVCEGCIYGKMHHLPFPKTSWRAKAPLELVHADIFGPTRNPSLQNKRDALENYSTEVDKLSRKILDFMAKALNFDNDGNVFGEISQAMRMNYYPPCSQSEKVIGIVPHTDATALITILLQLNEIEGLQINKDNKWIAVDPPPDAFIVNIGDILEIMSNGMYRSVMHRAVVNATKERLSIATFVSPSLDREIGPNPRLINSINRAKFKRISMKDYWKGFVDRPLDGRRYLDGVRIVDDDA